MEGRAGESFVLANTLIDENIFPTHNIALVAGRNFSLDQDQPASGGAGTNAPEDIGSGTALINEAAASFLGFADPSDAIGKLIDAT